MGKKWDSSGIAYSVELWTECLRVLKPGGHLLAFGGTRTYHRMVVSIEDAGFEIRDMISWISNKTFPKSLNVSKAIDKSSGENEKRRLEFVAWMKTTGLNAKKINEIIGKADVGSHYLRLDQPAIATADLFDKLRPHLPEVPEAIERLVAERTGIEWTEYKKRVVTGLRRLPVGHAFAGPLYGGDSSMHEVNETASFSAEAKKWEGWGTGLKPTVEPIVMARKPIQGTVANNVLTYGTGALNIDGSRIGTELRKNNVNDFSNQHGNQFANGKPIIKTGESEVKGRWPANIILDEQTAGLLDEQSGQVKGGTWNNTAGARHFNNDGKPTDYETKGSDKSIGGASRFFYVAKTSKRDRNEGLEKLQDYDWKNDGAAIPNRKIRPFTPSKNHHPTVKPTTLMQYLVKLVTPPNGTVLDPFTGSGSTGKAAILEGFNFIGIEMTDEYLPIIEGRLKHAEDKVAERIKKTSTQESEKLF
jgi:DNA modification methylase